MHLKANPWVTSASPLPSSCCHFLYCHLRSPCTTPTTNDQLEQTGNHNFMAPLSLRTCFCLRAPWTLLQKSTEIREATSPWSAVKYVKLNLGDTWSTLVSLPGMLIIKCTWQSGVLQEAVTWDSQNCPQHLSVPVGRWEGGFRITVFLSMTILMSIEAEAVEA